jgi:sec-independent protein translocase protein TatC
VFTSPFQFLNLAVNSALVVGMIVAFPFTIAQLLSFLKPALRKKEYKTIITLLPLSIILFLFGFSYGTLMMKYMLVLFYEKSLSLNIGNFLDISNLLSKIILTSTLMGLAFQFPIILTVLMKFKIITHEALKKQRFIAWSVALIFAAFMPPTDILSLMLLTLPLVILFETTLIFNRVMKT